MYVSDTLYSSLTQLELSRSRGKERKKEARLTLGRALGKKVRKDTTDGGIKKRKAHEERWTEERKKRITPSFRRGKKERGRERERRREAREIYGIVEAARVLVAVLAHERARW